MAVESPICQESDSEISDENDILKGFYVRLVTVYELSYETKTVLIYAHQFAYITSHHAFAF